MRDLGIVNVLRRQRLAKDASRKTASILRATGRRREGDSGCGSRRRRSKRQLRWNRFAPRELEPEAGEWQVGRPCSEFQSFFTDLERHNRFFTDTAAVLGHVEG